MVAIDNGNTTEDEVAISFAQMGEDFKVGRNYAPFKDGFCTRRFDLIWTGNVEIEGPLVIVGEVVHLTSIAHSVYALVQKL